MTCSVSSRRMRKTIFLTIMHSFTHGFKHLLKTNSPDPRQHAPLRSLAMWCYQEQCMALIILNTKTWQPLQVMTLPWVYLFLFVSLNFERKHKRRHLAECFVSPLHKFELVFGLCVWVYVYIYFFFAKQQDSFSIKSIALRICLCKDY